MRSVIPHGLILLSASCLLSAQVQLDVSDKQGTVEIVVVDANGVPLRGDIRVTAYQLVDGKYGPETVVGMKPKLRYSTYKLVVRGSPAYPVEKIITVNEPYQVVLVGLFVAPIELPWIGNAVHGKLPPNQQGRCRWVRLISPVSDTEEATARALDSGDFTLENVKPGTYIVVTFGDGGICNSGQTLVADKRTQDLTIRW